MERINAGCGYVIPISKNDAKAMCEHYGAETLTELASVIPVGNIETAENIDSIWVFRGDLLPIGKKELCGEVGVWSVRSWTIDNEINAEIRSVLPGVEPKDMHYPHFELVLAK